MNIFLIGFMGTGKTTTSRNLSKMLSQPEVDVDAWIVKKEGRAIADIFSEEGEEAFRDMETGAIEEISEKDNQIVSCGGGTVLRDKNVEIMKQHGKIVLLTAMPETILERVRYSGERPILNGNMNVEYIEKLMEKRRERYEKAADVIIKTDNKSVREIAKEIVEKIR